MVQLAQGRRSWGRHLRTAECCVPAGCHASDAAGRWVLAEWGSAARLCAAAGCHRHSSPWGPGTNCAPARPPADLYEHGFEWTLLHGEPRNPGANTYRVPKTCCRMKVVGGPRGSYECLTEWDKMEDLPFGNPFSGGDVWHGTAPDTGKYNGSTIKQELL